MRIRPESFAFTLFLSGLGAILPLSIDMGLPALGAISHSLRATPAAAGQTLSLFMAGFAVAPVAFGPLSDRYGRRPVLLAGLILFTLAGLACAAAPVMGILLLARLLQGAGAGAGMVLAFAIVRDLFEGHLARARLSYVNIVLNVAPMVAPTLGALALARGGWRAIYAALAAGGLLVLLAVLLGFGESLAPERRHPLGPRQLLYNYGRVLGHRASLGHALVNALSFACMFSYVAGSPLVMLNLLHVTPAQYGGIFAATAFGIMTGSFVNGRLSTRGVPGGRPLAVGLVMQTATAVLLVLATVLHVTPLPVLLPLLVLNTFSRGLISPNAVHGALQPLPEIAGVASAVVSCLQMACGAAASALVALLFDGRTPLAMTGMMLLFALLSALSYLFLARPAPAAAPARVPAAE